MTSVRGIFKPSYISFISPNQLSRPILNFLLSSIVSVQPNCEKTADRCFSTHVQTAGAVNYPRCTPTRNKQMYDDYNNFCLRWKTLTQWDFDFVHRNTESKCPRLNVWWTGEREQSIYMRPSQVFTYCVLTYTVPYVGSSVLHTAAVLAQHNLKPPGCTLTISGPYNLCYCCCNWTVTTNNGPDVALHVCVCYVGHDRNI